MLIAGLSGQRELLLGLLCSKQTCFVPLNSRPGLDQLLPLPYIMLLSCSKNRPPVACPCVLRSNKAEDGTGIAQLKGLAVRGPDGKLQSAEYIGGTLSLVSSSGQKPFS